MICGKIKPYDMEVSVRGFLFAVLSCVCMFSNAVFALTLTVKDATETLIGASVYINGDLIGITDIDGKYELKDVKTGDKIKVSNLGHKDAEKDVVDGADLTIIMQEDAKDLAEVSVTTCGANKEKDKNGNCVCREGFKEILGTGGKASICECKIENGVGKIEDKKCVLHKCNEPRYEESRGKCVEQKCVIKYGVGKWDDNNQCIVSKCNDGYVQPEDKQECVVSQGPCTAEQLKKIPHAVKGEQLKNVCSATECEEGYKVARGKCVSLAEEAESQAKIDELQDEADAAHETENSTANKLLGAAGMGATGIGAMQMMSGIAEQKADENAEAQMKAYLATFRCNYGGLNHKGGEMNVELPGAGNLLPLYTEYVNLANDLKVRKAALGLRPGIESEPILDAATSGLYDDIGTGITSGTYTSLARALMDPNGEDAKKWAEQAESAAKKKKTGMITAGVGAAGSLIGNLIINRDKDDSDESDEEIAEKYSFLQTFVEDIKNLPTPEATCPNDADGTYPNCKCKNGYTYSAKWENKCYIASGQDEAPEGRMSDTSSYDVSVTIPTKNMFVVNDFNMTKEAKKITKNFIKDLKSLDPKKCKIGIAVYTDRFLGTVENKRYAKKYANIIKEELSDHDGKLSVEYDVANDKDDFSPIVCSCADFNDQSHCQSRESRLPAIYPDCRRAVISLDCDFKNNTNLADKLGIIAGQIE